MGLKQPFQILLRAFLFRVAKDFFGRPGFDHLAQVHKNHMVRQALDLAQGMRNDDRGVLALQFEQFLFDVLG